MNAENFEAACGVIPASYARQAQQGRRRRENLIKSLLSQRRLPDEGWDEETIELFLHELAAMDSNNFVDNVGVGEREARVYSGIVARRHYRMAHGVGRSGDVAASQPKAAGSSLVNSITRRLALDAVRICGFVDAASVLVLPLATGMAITMALLALRQQRKAGRVVVWSRVDQKSCVKSIAAAGLEVEVVEGVLEGDELRTDLPAIEAAVSSREREAPGSVLCVVSTTSCFAPRAPERVVKAPRLCARLGVGHLVNNAYGLQSARTAHKLSKACRRGRVDAVVQSTDKNFMVPVGGSILAAKDPTLIEAVNGMYPGRASSGPVLDLFVTLLAMGAAGLRSLLRQREELLPEMRARLAAVAEARGERLLHTPRNPISLAMTVDKVGASARERTQLGAMLYSRCVSGVRVVSADGPSQKVAGREFRHYGAHHDAYPHSYLTAACAVGLTRPEFEAFAQRLERTLGELAKMRAKGAAAAGAAGAAAAPTEGAPAEAGVRADFGGDVGADGEGAP
eukprot:tig00000498_g1602.t1